MGCFVDAYERYDHARGYNYSAISFCEAALVLYQLTREKKQYLDIAPPHYLGSGAHVPGCFPAGMGQ